MDEFFRLLRIRIVRVSRSHTCTMIRLKRTHNQSGHVRMRKLRFTILQLLVVLAATNARRRLQELESASKTSAIIDVGSFDRKMLNTIFQSGLLKLSKRSSSLCLLDERASRSVVAFSTYCLLFSEGRCMFDSSPKHYGWRLSCQSWEYCVGDSRRKRGIHQ